ncbi:MAG: phosphoglycerate dehydrogenase [Cyclobacteriaceae bacterium]|nr:phosphoglycerate dehydrogenase [Cyclobacteriaceae bacterium]MCH8517468.1 phosphoglycerate dehydrogenase [Cyclobacteriaceae bacterium]
MSTSKKNFVIDFDSTVTRVEALDVLGEIALENDPEKKEKLQKIKDITDGGMDGSVSLDKSLKERIDILQAHRNHIPTLVANLKQKISTSFRRNKDFFKNHQDNIYILSNGFKDFIVPVVVDLGVKEANVFANEFVYDDQGNIVDFERSNLLSKNGGKAEQIRALSLQGEVYVIGDGYTDYEIKEAGLATRFYAFTENISRKAVTDKTDHIAPSLDEFLYQFKMNTSLSYPKNRIKVLLLENIHPDAARALLEEGYQVETLAGALDEDELCERIKDVSILGIRSKTQVTAKVLKKAKRLLAIGAFCIGTNQIDLQTAMRRGIAVFNAPFSNTRSVVELAIGELIILARNLADTFHEMHQGKWNKSAKNATEIRGKKLGIVGYGNIGAQLSVVAESIGLDVYFYDIEDKLALGNATACSSLEELCKTVDFVSLHVDGRPENTNVFGEQEFGWMKDGVIFMNLSRGQVVDIAALKKALESGKVKGAAVDVFPEEPKTNDDVFESELRGIPNLLMTPHIGGSTMEAQVSIAEYVPNKIMQYINTGSTTNSANFPNLQLPVLKKAHRIIHIHQNVPGVMAKMNRIFGENEINISGQYLKTNEEIGYVITDIDKGYDESLLKQLKSIEGTLRFRILY